MFKSRTDLYDSKAVREIRKAVYHDDGYFVVKNFVARGVARPLIERWARGDYNYRFHDYIANKDVRIGSPDYFIRRPTPDDWAFSMHMWNPPVDEILHSIVLEAQQLRNLVEGRWLFFGVQNNDPLILQYRLARTLSTGAAVKPHADFMEEFRNDATGSHAFDPRRCQMTLFLSDYDADYTGGGFKLRTNKDERVLFGRDVKAGTGDLVIWKYTNIHEVSTIKPLNNIVGFSRVIFPLFDRSVVDVPA